MTSRQEREDQRRQDPRRWHRLITTNRESQLLANPNDKRYKLGELFDRHYMIKMEEACKQFTAIHEECILRHEQRAFVPFNYAEAMLSELLKKEETCGEAAKAAMIVELGFHFYDFPSQDETPIQFQQEPQDVIDYMITIGDTQHSLRQRLETARGSIASRLSARVTRDRPGSVLNVSALGG